MSGLVGKTQRSATVSDDYAGRSWYDEQCFIQCAREQQQQVSTPPSLFRQSTYGIREREGENNEFQDPKEKEKDDQRENRQKYTTWSKACFVLNWIEEEDEENAQYEVNMIWLKCIWIKNRTQYCCLSKTNRSRSSQRQFLFRESDMNPL